MAVKSWNQQAGGLWATVADWTPSGAPGAADSVTITGQTYAYQILTGPGSASSLVFLGDTVINGIFVDTGAAALGVTGTAGGLDLAPGTVLVASTMSFVGGTAAAYGTGTGLAISGAATFGGSNVSYNALAAYDGAAVQLGSVVATANYSLSVDAQSVMEIGKANDSVVGKITIDAGQTLSGGGSLSAAGGIVNKGTITVAGTALTINGPVTGSGVTQIGTSGTLNLASGVSTQAIAFTGAGGRLAASYYDYSTTDYEVRVSAKGTVSGFTFGDVIAIGAVLTSATYQSIGNGLGTLTLMDGTRLIDTMTLAGNYAGDAFQVAPDLLTIGTTSYSSGTQITLITGTPGGAITPNPGTAAPDHYTWIAAKGGNWGAAVNWTDTTTGTTPATVAPGANDVVLIDAGVNGVETSSVVSGPAHAAALTILGSITLNGSYVLGSFTTGGTAALAYVDLAPGTHVTTGVANVSDGSLIAGDTDTAVTVTGALTLGGGGYAGLSAFNGGVVRVGSLVLSTTFTSVEAISGGTVEIGSAGGAAVGTLTVDAGQTVTGLGTFTTDAGLINNGVIKAVSGLLQLNGDITGSGSLQVGTSGTLALVGSNTEVVSFVGTGGTLALSVAGYGPILPVNEHGTISGFAGGDTIQVGQILTAVKYQATGASIGTLTLMYGTSVIATLTLAGTYTPGFFKMTLGKSTFGNVTNITLAPGLGTPSTTPSAGTTAPNAYSLTNAGVLNWGDAVNWTDTTTAANPAAIAPGSTDAVSLVGPSITTTGQPALVLDGPGNAASLSIVGNVVLSGAYSVGAMTLTTSAPSLTLAPGTVLNASSVNSPGTASISATGANTRLVVAGAVSGTGNGVLNVGLTSGASLQMGSLALGSDVDLSVDATSSVEIGGGGHATAGTITIDAGQFVGGPNLFLYADKGIVDSGTIIAQNFAYLGGPVTGPGQIQIAAAATLTLTAGVSTAAIAFTGAGGTLVISNTNYVDPTLSPTITTSGVISGFRAGDTLQYHGHITNATYQATGSGIGTLTLHFGTLILGTLTLAGNYSTEQFNVTPESSGGDTLYDIRLGPAPGTTTTPADFNADGKSDLLLQNTSGAIVIETQSNLAITNGIAAGNPGPSWHVMGSADCR